MTGSEISIFTNRSVAGAQLPINFSDRFIWEQGKFPLWISIESIAANVLLAVKSRHSMRQSSRNKYTLHNNSLISQALLSCQFSKHSTKVDSHVFVW